jgi:hypothetical protein
MPYVWASCPCDYRIQNLVRLNPPKIEEQEPKIEEQKMNEYRKKILALMGNPFAPYAPKIEEQEPKIRGQKMTKEDISRMCSQAIDETKRVGSPLFRFAALVAAAEREACAQIADEEAQLFGITDDVVAHRIRERGNT